MQFQITLLAALAATATAAYAPLNNGTVSAAMYPTGTGSASKPTGTGSAGGKATPTSQVPFTGAASKASIGSAMMVVVGGVALVSLTGPFDLPWERPAWETVANKCDQMI
jgi:hypothetical protein